MKPYLTSHIKDKNRRTVYNILKTGRELSCSEINRRTGISVPTVMKIVDFYRERGFLSDAGIGNSTQGKKPQMLRFNPLALLAIGVEFEGELLKLGMVDLAGETSHLRQIPVEPSFDAVFSVQLPGAIEALLADARLPRARIAGIGIGLPGVVDSRNAIIEYAPLVGICERRSFSDTKTFLESRFGLPVGVENDVNADALGEFTARGLSHDSDLFYVSLGAGLGAGIIIEGRLWKGRTNSAGEIGYMVFDREARASRSRAGWLEQRVNLPALAAKLPGAHVRSNDFEALVEGNDPERLALLVREVADDLALCLANAAAILDIQLVVLGGITARLLGDPLLEAVRDRLHRLSISTMRLERGRCEEPGVVGAAIPALEEGLDRIMVES